MIDPIMAWLELSKASDSLHSQLNATVRFRALFEQLSKEVPELQTEFPIGELLDSLHRVRTRANDAATTRATLYSLLKRLSRDDSSPLHVLDSTDVNGASARQHTLEGQIQIFRDEEQYIISQLPAPRIPVPDNESAWITVLRQELLSLQDRRRTLESELEVCIRTAEELRLIEADHRREIEALHRILGSDCEIDSASCEFALSMLDELAQDTNKQIARTVDDIKESIAMAHESDVFMAALARRSVAFIKSMNERREREASRERANELARHVDNRSHGSSELRWWES